METVYFQFKMCKKMTPMFSNLRSPLRVYWLFLTVFVSLAPVLAQAKLLDVDRALKDGPYRDEIREIFVHIKQLQIGGTHFDGEPAVRIAPGRQVKEVDP